MTRSARFLPVAPALSSLFVLSWLVTLAGCGQEDVSGPDGEATEGSIAVLTNGVTGAEILLDRGTTGLVAPDTLTHIPAGEHVIAVVRSGFTASPESETINVTGGLTTVTFTLTPLAETGSIAVEADIAGGDILLDGHPTGLTAPDTIETVAPGDHEVMVERLGFTVSPDGDPVTVIAGEVATTTEFHLEAIQATSKTVLLEHFTAWECVPCQNADPKIDSLGKDLTRDEVVHITYHWISTTGDDPYYLANPSDVNDRREYYGVAGMPSLFLCGREFAPVGFGWTMVEAYQTLRDSTLARHDETPLMTITVAARQIGGVFRARAAVTSHADFSSGGLRLHFVMVEHEIIPTGPQPQGQTHYSWVMRDMVDDSAGEALAIAEGETLTFEQEIVLAPAWNSSQMGLVVFVQRDDGTKEVLQAGSTF